MNTKTITERLDALRIKSDAEDERDRMLALGADQESSDWHSRAVLSLSAKGIHSPTADEYVQAVEAERLADQPADPTTPRRPDDAAIHTAAIQLLASRGIHKPNYREYSDALAEVNSQ